MISHSGQEDFQVLKVQPFSWINADGKISPGLKECHLPFNDRHLTGTTVHKDCLMLNLICFADSQDCFFYNAFFIFALFIVVYVEYVRDQLCCE